MRLEDSIVHLCHGTPKAPLELQWMLCQSGYMMQLNPMWEKVKALAAAKKLHIINVGLPVKRVCHSYAVKEWTGKYKRMRE